VLHQPIKNKQVAIFCAPDSLNILANFQFIVIMSPCPRRYYQENITSILEFPITHHIHVFNYLADDRLQSLNYQIIHFGFTQF